MLFLWEQVTTLLRTLDGDSINCLMATSQRYNSSCARLLSPKSRNSMSGKLRSSTKRVGA